MTAAFIGVCTALIMTGAILTVSGLRGPHRVGPTVDSDAPESFALLRPRLWTSLGTVWKTHALQRPGLLIGAIAAGLVALLVTRWVPSVVIIPVLLLILPALLSDPADHEIELLEALDRWIQLLTASIATGKSIAEAICATTRQSPKLMREPLQLVNARMDDLWTLPDALTELADELHSSDVDQVVASLMIASRRGGVGIRGTLTALGNSLQDTLVARREIVAEQAKPRMVVRQVTVITLLALSFSMITNPGYFQPYTQGVGQVIAILLAAGYLASLLMLRRMSRPVPRERLLMLGAAGVHRG